MKVYALGVMRIEYDHEFSKDDEPVFMKKEDRLWFLYSNFEDAEKAMLSNWSDLFEYTYNVGLIEEVYVMGKDTRNTAFDGREQRWWYLAQYEEDSSAPFGKRGPFISKIECPHFFKNTYGFWVG